MREGTGVVPFLALGDKNISISEGGPGRARGEAYIVGTDQPPFSLQFGSEPAELLGIGVIERQDFERRQELGERYPIPLDMGAVVDPILQFSHRDAEDKDLWEGISSRARGILSYTVRGHIFRNRDTVLKKFFGI